MIEVDSNNRICEFCDSINIVAKGVVNKFTILQCTDCEASYVLEMPSLEFLENFYKSGKLDKWNRRNEADLKSIYKSFRENESSKKDFFISVLDEAKEVLGKEKLKILEIGSAKGLFIDFAKSMGHEAVGTEASRDVVNYVNEFHPGYLKFVEKNQFSRVFVDEKFDMIYLEHVYEHLPNTKQIINQFFQLLKSGGILYLVVPNHGSFRARRLGLKWENVMPPFHLYFFTKKSVTRLLNNQGFDIEKIRFINTYHGTIWVFYSIDKYLNNILKRLPYFKYRQLKPINDSPKNIFHKLRLLPYFFHNLQKNRAISEFEDEMVVIASKK